jgi:hypothetical protein
LKKNAIVDNYLFTKHLMAKLPNWRYFFEILAKLGVRRGADYIFGLKGKQSGILERSTTKLNGIFFPPESDTP